MPGLHGGVSQRSHVSSVPCPLAEPCVCVYCVCQVSLCLQPLVGGVHGTLLCFAQWPSLVSQTFPLIFHRLIRTAEARNF